MEGDQKLKKRPPNFLLSRGFKVRILAGPPPLFSAVDTASLFRFSVYKDFHVRHFRFGFVPEKPRSLPIEPSLIRFPGIDLRHAGALVAALGCDLMGTAQAVGDAGEGALADAVSTAMG
jgi:hypothetical protein